MFDSLKINRKRLASAIQLEGQRIRLAPITLLGERLKIVHRLRALELQLDACENTIRSLQGS